MSESTTQSKLGVLLELWHGTDDDVGYMHDELVIAACDIGTPVNLGQVVRQFYPDVKTTLTGGAWVVEPELPAGAFEVLEHGFKLWQLRRKMSS